LLFFRIGALGVILALGTRVASARAAEADSEPPKERIALVYSAPEECPAGDAFRAEVRERASGDWEARPDELARRISVTVTKRGDEYVASIEFLTAEGETVTRSLGGKGCGDVVDGIALVTALAIQSRVEEALARSEPVTPKAPPPVSKPAPRVVSPPPARPKPPRSTRLRFGAAARAASGTGPDVSFGPAAFGAVEWQKTRFGLVLGALWSGSVTAGGVPAHFRRLSARVDGCPYAFGTPKLALEPCAFFEAGSLHGQGDSSAGLSNPSGGSSPWLVPGGLLRLVTGFAPVVVELELGGGVTLVRQQFGVVVDGKEHPTFTVPKGVFDAALGLGFRL
jgi:hypothetical protein